jgi:hypothetical protein
LDPGERLLLLDLDAATANEHEGVIASASAVRDQTIEPQMIRFHATGVENSRAIICVATKTPPTAIELDGKDLSADHYHFEQGFLWLDFPNTATDRTITITR